MLHLIRPDEALVDKNTAFNWKLSLIFYVKKLRKSVFYGPHFFQTKLLVLPAIVVLGDDHLSVTKLVNL